MSRVAPSVRLVEGAACLLALLALRALPPPRVWLRGGSTPFDAGPVASVAPAYALLRDAQRVVPTRASVLARREPADPRADTYFYRAALAMLPERNVLPSAVNFAEETGLERSAEYLILLGPAGERAGFRRVLETRDGSVWRREP